MCYKPHTVRFELNVKYKVRSRHNFIKMDSKLPKPTGLKRPMPLPRSILPTDRIKPASELTGSCAALNSYMPLSSNLANIREGVVRRNNRAVSPDILRANSVRTEARGKLRRSRSACDLRDLRRPLKRADITLAPVPAKTARYGANVTIGSSGYGINRPPRIGTTAATSTSTSNLSNNNTNNAFTKKINHITTSLTGVRTLNTRPGTSASTAAKKTTTSTATSCSATTKTANTGAGKTINKRIPPYDYKARFLDLQEKHKVLKGKYEEILEQMNNLENLPEQLEECQEQLYNTQEQLKRLENENQSLHTQVSVQNTKISSLSSSLSETQRELKQLKLEHEALSQEHGIVSKEAVELRTRIAECTQRLVTLEEELTICRDQLFTWNLERKELHNTVMDLRGNIRVFCRVRPPLDIEAERSLCGWNYLDEATVELQSYEISGVSMTKTKAAAHTFSFDQVFHPNSSQDDIFEMVSPLIQSALDGYNICIFAYGQTGSGKTYTMDGTNGHPGVIPRTVDLLFNAIKNYKRLGWEYEIKATFLEIYNEVLYDLLSNEQKDMEIRMVKNSRNDIYVSNITEEVVDSTTRLRELMHIAKMNRATAATVSNERSSRSHAVTRIELIGCHTEKNELSVGTINLVDLAGSESPKTSIRMNETKNINRSLSELTNVILALLQKQDHIPYRNSKLTHLLMPSLGGNSKTLMFINVAPFQDCFGESVKSLRFAASVNSCKVAKAKRNRYLNPQLNSSSSSLI